MVFVCLYFIIRSIAAYNKECIYFDRFDLANMIKLPSILLFDCLNIFVCLFVSLFTCSLRLGLTEALFSLNSVLIHLFPSLDVLILKWLLVLLRIFHDTEMLSKLPAEKGVSILPYLCLWKIIECILVKQQKYTLLVINHCCGQERNHETQNHMSCFSPIYPT